MAALSPEDKYIIRGIGITIEMYVTQKGRITTAYPKL